jgi:phage gpG-like protein
MNPQEFEREVSKKAQEIKNLIENRLPIQIGKKAMRFINGNFSAQGWQGGSFQKWKPNKRGGRILVHKGHLRRDTYFQTQPALTILKNDLPYAKINNEGGTIKGSATVKSYTRKGYTRKVKGKKQTVKPSTIKTHTRNMNITIPQRQFFPTKSSPSLVLDNAVRREVVREINKLFKI